MAVQNADGGSDAVNAETVQNFAGRLRPDFTLGFAAAAFQIEGFGSGRPRAVRLGCLCGHTRQHPPRAFAGGGL
jgi:hypothetical protein